MAIQAQGAAVTPTRHIPLRQQLRWLIPIVIGAILLGFAIYLLILRQHIEAKMAALPQVRELLTNTNGRLETVSRQLDQVDGSVKNIAPLLKRWTAEMGWCSRICTRTPPQYPIR